MGLRIFCAAGVFLMACAPQALGVDRTWQGLLSATYSNNASWTDLVAPSGAADRAFFTNSAATTGGVTFTNSPTVGTAVVSGSTVGGNYNFVESGNQTWTIVDQFQFNNTTNLTTAAITGLTVNAGSVTFLGSNTLNLSTGAVLSSTGSLQLGSSTINFGSNSQLSAGSIVSTGGGRINASGTLSLLGDSTFSASTLTVNGTGTIGLSNATLNVANGGLLQLNRDWHVMNNSTLRLASGGDVFVAAGQYLDVGYASTGTLLVDGAGSTIIADPSSIGAYWGAGGNVAVSFSGGGAGTFTFLDIGTDDGQAAVNVFSSSTLSINAFVLGGTVNSATIAVNGGTLRIGTGTINSGGKITVAGPLTNGTLNIGDSLTVNEGGHLEYGYINTFSAMSIAAGGSLHVNGGSVHMNTGYAFNPGAMISISSGTLQADGYVDIGGAGSGTLVVSGAASHFTAGANSYIGANLGSGTAIFKNGAAGTFSQGVVLGAAGSGRIEIFSDDEENIATVTLSGNASYVQGTSQLNIGTLGVLNLNENMTVETGGQLNFGAAATALNVAAGKRILVTSGAVATFDRDYGVSPGSGFAIDNGTLNANGFWFDIGNSSVATLSVSGSSGRITDLGDSYWGANVGGNATIEFSDSGVGTFTHLWVGANGGQALVNVDSSAVLNITGTVAFGGDDLPHSAQVNVTSASFLSTGTASFRDGSTLTLNSGTASFNHLNVESGARLNYIGGLMTASTLTMTGGQIILGGDPITALGVSTLNLSGGTIDLRGDGMAVNTLHTPLSTIRGYLAAGRIVNSGADGIVWKLAYQMNPGISDFYGVPVDANSALLATGLVGDTDYNYFVDTVDFNNLAGSFGNGSNNFWKNGDFDYDGDVDSIDYTAFIANYGYNAFSGPTLGVVVPEPASAIFALLILCLPHRRRS